MSSRFILFCTLGLFVLPAFISAETKPTMAPKTLKLPQMEMLPNGATVILEGVTYGKNHQFGDMKYYDYSNGQLTHADQSDAIILWIRCDPPAAGTKTKPQMSFNPESIHIFDDSGQERLLNEFNIQKRPFSKNRWAIWLSTWPRRGAFFTAAIDLDGDNRGAVGLKPNYCYAKFRIPPPRIATDKPYKPSRTPITRSDSELEATLVDLRQAPPIVFVSGPPDYVEKLYRGEKLDTTVEFRCKYHGVVTEDWKPTKAVITDSTGNTYSCTASSLYQLRYYRSDSNEPLKLGVWFERTGSADFAPGETGTVTNVRFNQGGRSNIQDAQVRIGDVTVKLVDISEVECVGKRTALLFNVYGGDPQLSLLLQVQNEKGETAHGIRPYAQAKWLSSSLRKPTRLEFKNGGSDVKPHRCASFLMDMPPGTSHFSFTVALNRAHYFEFTPDPTIIWPQKLPY